ncbi:AAA family ATPase [Petrotoga sp. 9PWA.NaAc.5.4]|uniref:AAA family ATPase n=1 Tax=Petrotoga sp. 9PWA.NaAc.5.4 TaxID=1434328 RepID=UPI000CC90388|nr:AAA family ATPase [Petrotoga sp. 9PWA.NaAc.5.4]PNR92756.1 restriction endonuclease [Petrotoga sp. 9PWA.NaAc.5.4]
MFKNPDNPHHSFPDLSYEALKLRKNKNKETNINEDEELTLKKTVQELDEKYKESKYEKYTKEDFLKEVFMDERKYNTLVNLLKMKKNLILQGPPGVGKTFVAKRLAYSIIGEKDTERVTMIQFHQSYSYEDFILGYRPKEDGFELKTGPFYEFCKKASNDPKREYFFIIDEINRGNISKILGELLMLIEKDKRGEEIKLLYTDELFTVPENLYIIGTMNTADRSIAIIDYALRRRFSFIDLKPAFKSDTFKTNIIEKNSNPKFKSLIDKIEELNEEIRKEDSLGEGFQIGHSYFCSNGEPVTNEWLENIVEYEIIPLLKEYWYDNSEKCKKWEEELKGVIK